jgi:ubiquinone/menaquinone biosynthesis C-methylase UbiE
MAGKFANRSEELELMDDFQSGGDAIRQTLRELEFINKWLGGNKVTLRALDALLKDHSLDKPLVMVDLGCGSGDMLRKVANWARSHHRQVSLIGVDANPHIIEYARKHSKDYPEITWMVENVFSESYRSLKVDVVMCTLFAHHIKDQDLVRLFSICQKQASIGLVINDLHRHWLAYYLIKWLTLAFSKSEMVKNDAPLSVARSFQKKELAHLLLEGGFTDIQIDWRWAFRWQVVAKG